MYCDNCGNSYNDNEYIDKQSEIGNLNYFDKIELEVWSRDFKAGKGYKWFKECDDEMDRMIKELSK